MHAASIAGIPSRPSLIMEYYYYFTEFVARYWINTSRLYTHMRSIRIIVLTIYYVMRDVQ